MKRYFGVLIISLAIASTAFSQSMESEYVAGVVAFQDSINKVYSDPDTSILSRKQRKNFKGISFYKIQPTYRVVATFTRTPDVEPFMMPTSAGISREYVQYGVARFALQGQEFDLPIYQNPQFTATPDHEYKNSLMLGYTDYTSGDGSYGGGRYIDILITDIKDDKLIIDFNKSYNPYCAYTTGYACAIPPDENDLRVRIEAGVQDYEGEH